MHAISTYQNFTAIESLSHFLLIYKQARRVNSAVFDRKWRVLVARPGNKIALQGVGESITFRLRFQATSVVGPPVIRINGFRRIAKAVQRSPAPNVHAKILSCLVLGARPT